MSHINHTGTFVRHLNDPPLSKSKRLGDILLGKGAVDPGDLFKALALQQHEDLRLGEILTGLNFADKKTVLAALGEQAALPVVDIDQDPPTRPVACIYPVVDAITQGFVVWKQLGETLVVAIYGPEQQESVKKQLAHITPHVLFVLTPKESIQRYYRTQFVAELSETANIRCPERLSIRSWGGQKTRFFGLFMLAVVLGWVVFAPETFLYLLFSWIMISLIANGGFKLVHLVNFLRNPPAKTPNAPAKKLPKISILIPLLNESDILDRLVQRMSALVYPKELLDICLVYEANDNKTRAHLASQNLPAWFHAIEVPPSQVQTKPRALNYALDFCHGDIIGIYDAEDAPEPDQLYRVVSRLENADRSVACVQCQLDFYNSKTNWLSRCFTIEYASLFRVILPMLECLDLPLPLGGTSVFFRRGHLERLGRWDAHNVTEDADLGMRLYRAGMRCLWVNATTFEEANFRPLPWVRQRSRWLKGFLQTWITHMRTPRKLVREMGWRGFLTFHIQLLGTFTSFAAAPVILPMWALSFGFDLPVYDVLSPMLRNIMVAAFIATELLLLVIGIIAVRQKGDSSLYRSLPMMLIYWPLGAFAAYKALYELFVKPDYWDKTPHGINDHSCEAEIARLTDKNGIADLLPRA